MLQAHFTSASTFPTDEDVWEWVDIARTRLAKAAEQFEESPRAFATTLVAFALKDEELLTVHVGDGAIVGRSKEGDWRIFSGPENGEYASTTFFVTDDPAPRLRIARHEVGLNGLAVFSDGIEDLALDQRTCEPHAPFFNAMLGAVDAKSGAGRDRNLSAALEGFLASPRVCEKTDDDKSLILASSR